MDTYTSEQQIIQRKSIRIGRARVLTEQLKQDIENNVEDIPTQTQLLVEINRILPYLTNDDETENMFNYDYDDNKISQEEKNETVICQRCKHMISKEKSVQLIPVVNHSLQLLRNQFLETEGMFCNECFNFMKR